MALLSGRLAEQWLRLLLPAAWLMERLFLSPSHSAPSPSSCRTTLAVPEGRRVPRSSQRKQDSRPALSWHEPLRPPPLLEQGTLGSF